MKLYDQILQESPRENVLWNAGMAAYFNGDGTRAAEYWTRLKSSSPLDWRVRAKLIQAYTLSGETDKAQSEHKELLALEKKQPELFDKPYFCREQFEAGGRKVMSMEYFHLTPPRALKYAFLVLDEEGEKVDYRLSLGSYEATNEFMRETGSLEDGERAFHLDGYYKNDTTHSTFDFYKGEPSYEDIRKVVVDILEGRRKPISSSERAE